jgi:peroxiredoxin
LEQLKALQHLKIYSANNFSPIALQRLQDNLPNLSSFTADQDRKLKTISKTKPNPSTNNTVAPSFAIETLDGKDIKLEDYRGKVVVLYFWATWCRPCVAGTPELKKVYADMKTSFGNDFEMISLSMDDSEHLVREHIKKYDLTWPQARIGLNSKISSDYGVNDRAPMYFLIGPDGKILLSPESPQVDTKSFVEGLLKNRKS